MPGKRPQGENDFDRQIGVGLGLGMTQVALAQHLECSENTIGNRIKANRSYIDQVCSETKGLAAKTLSQKIADSVEAKSRIRENAWKQLADLVEKKGLRPQEQLALIRECLDRTEGRSVTRVHMTGQVEHEHTVQIPTRVFDALDVVLREQKLLPEAIDVEPIP